MRIPKIFHFVFGLKEQNSPFHLMYYLCLKSCMEINRPDTIYFYYEHEPYGAYWELIKPKLTLVKVSANPFVQSFKYPIIGRKRFRYAHHADFIRLEKLIVKGGVYADIDTLFIKKLPDELFQKPFVLGREPDIISETTGEKHRSLCNAFIMSEPNSSFANRWLDNMKTCFDGSWSNHSTVLPQKLSEEYPGDIHIEPERSFYPFVWTKRDLKALFEEDKAGIENIQGAYSIHLWGHLWNSPSRNSFSSFNETLLNEDYIRKGETTYARLAMPFLPEDVELGSVKNPPVRVLIQKRLKKTMTDFRYQFERVAAKIQYLMGS